MRAVSLRLSDASVCEFDSVCFIEFFFFLLPRGGIGGTRLSSGCEDVTRFNAPQSQTLWPARRAATAATATTSVFTNTQLTR